MKAPDLTEAAVIAAAENSEKSCSQSGLNTFILPAALREEDNDLDAEFRFATHNEPNTLKHASWAKLFCLFSLLGLPLAAQTNISIGSTPLQTGVKRLGVNLGGQTFYDSLQLMKNLTNSNPGFSPTLYHSAVRCVSGSASTCTDSNGSTGWSSGFWMTGASGTTVQVITGTCAGLTTNLTAFSGPSGGNGGTFSFATPCPSGSVQNGDYLVAYQTISSTQTGLFYWWTSTSGSGNLSIENSDLPPSPSTSIQALQMMAPTGADSATFQGKFDSTAGHSFVRLNGTYQIQFWAKGLSGSQQVSVSFDRGGNYYLHPTTINLSSTWAPYTINFTAAETSTFPCAPSTGACVAQTSFTTVGADSFYLDNIQTIQLGSSSSNPTVFRDEVVSTLQTLKPGVIRYWGWQLGDTLDNMLADQFSRMPNNYTEYTQPSPNQYTYNSMAYGVTDFLQLVQTVGNGAEAWIVLPITTSPTEAANWIDYLSGGSNTLYGAKRIAQGFTSPWTSVIPKIHLEFGNEPWNSTFDGGNISIASTYGARAQVVFAAMKANPNYASGSMDLVLGAQASNASELQAVQNACNNNDSIAVAPYMMNGPTDASSTSAIWGPALTEPQAFYSNVSGVTAEGVSSNYFLVGGKAGTQSGGLMYLDLLAQANSTNPKPVNIYEENFSTNQGNYSQAQLNAYTSAWGAGLAMIEEELLGIQHGVLTQNLFQLAQWHIGTRISGESAYLWGSVVDMGGQTNLKRPQYLAMQVANSAISPGATLLQTTQTGTPTYTQSLLNSVAMTNSNLVQSFAFNNGSGNFGLILLNTDITSSHAVTFSGANAPPNGATVTQTVLTSANLSDTNETSSVVAPITSTLTAFNPTTGITLPPYSEVALIWGSSSSPVMTINPTSLTFSPTAVASSSTAQTIVLSNPGTVPVTISGISVTGANADDFSQTNTCGSALSASASCNIQVVFTPTASGSRTASISVANNTAASPQTVTLSGTATSNLHAAYYVSNSGNDSNDGLSAATAWQTVAKVNSASLNPGDTVLFQAGGLWREELTPNTSGTSGNQITYSSYGSGAQPIITAGNLATWTQGTGSPVSTNVWYTAQTVNPLFPNFGGTPGVQETSLSSLNAPNEWYWDGSSTLYVYSTVNPTNTVEIPARSYAVYSNTGVNYVTLQNLEARAAQIYGFQCYAASTGCSNWILNGNTVDLNYSNGAYILTSTAGVQSSGGVAQNNIFKNNGATGFKIGGYWASWSVTGNQIYQNCLQPGSGIENSYCGGIYLYSASGTDGAGSTISGNTVYNNGLAAQANGALGNGIWIDTASGVTVLNNTAYGNESNGIYFEKTVNSVAYQNLGYGNGGVTFTGCLTLAAGQGHNSTGNLIFENTCSGGFWDVGLNFEDTNGSMSNNTVQNNIFMNVSQPVIYGAQYVNDGTHGTNNVFANNSFGVAYSNFTCWASACQSSYSAFEAAYGGTTNSLQTAPGLVNAAGHNFHLTSNAAARSFGLAYTGYSAPCGNPDLGALPFPSVCPSTPSVVAGQSITVSSNNPSTFTLSGAGTCAGCGIAGATTVTYTAPASVVPNTTMQGCPVLPNDSVFNTPINASGFPLNANAPNWLGSGNVSTLPLSFQPSWGVTYADSTTPTFAVIPYWGDGVSSNVGYSTPFPGRTQVKRENGAFTSGSITATDHHTVIVNKSTCGFYEYYNDLVTLSGPEFSVTEACKYSGANCNVSSAIPPYNSVSYGAPAMSTDAAGLPLAPLTWTLADIKAGPKHAVRFTTAVAYINNSKAVWPATTFKGSNANAAPLGARFRLKTQANGGPNITSVCTSSGLLNQDCFNMLTALTQYGMILADVGKGNQVEIASDATQDPATRSAISLIQAAAIPINAANWDIVDESSLQETLQNGYQLPPSPSVASYAVDPANGYITPSSYAMVSGGGTKISIALQGVGIGLPSNTIAIAAGMSGYQIPAWVTPSTASHTVTWALVSGVGSITSGGVYTPPASTSGGVQAVLQATAAADPNVHANVYVNVLTNNSGTYSIDFNSLPAGSATSSPGKTWNNDFGIEAGSSSFSQTADTPAWQHPVGTNIPEYAQYGSYVLSNGGDIQFQAVVPNGNYKVRWMLGTPWNGKPSPQGSSPQDQMRVPDFFSVNGNVVAHFYDWNWAAGYQYATASDLYLPATVTNNVLRVAMHSLAPDAALTTASGLAPLYAGQFPNLVAPGCSSGCSKGSVAEGLEIIPDVSAPHWSIETQQITNVSAGQNVQLFVTDWYTGVNDPVWSIVSDSTGRASINSSTGLLSLASGVTFNGQPIIVRATDGTYTATTTLYAVGNSWPLNSHR